MLEVTQNKAIMDTVVSLCIWPTNVNKKYLTAGQDNHFGRRVIMQSRKIPDLMIEYRRFS